MCWQGRKTLHNPIQFSLCLGRRGLYTGSSGLTVAYLSGVETISSAGQAVADDAHFTAVDIDDLRQSLTGAVQFRGVDLLLTSQWPRAVDKYATAAVSDHSCSSVCNCITAVQMYALSYD